MIPSTDELVRHLRGPAGRGVAARILWGGLLAMHAPAIVSAGGTLIAEPTALGALRFIGLLATIALFAFKTSGRRILPTRTRPWIATAAFLALTAIAHAGLLPAKASDALAESAPSALVLISVGAFAANRRRIIRRLESLTDSFRRWLARFNTLAAHLAMVFAAFLHPAPALALAQRQRSGPAPTRGPPMLRAR